jgi:hypothetical protein
MIGAGYVGVADLDEAIRDEPGRAGRSGARSIRSSSTRHAAKTRWRDARLAALVARKRR